MLRHWFYYIVVMLQLAAHICDGQTMDDLIRPIEGVNKAMTGVWTGTVSFVNVLPPYEVEFI